MSYQSSDILLPSETLFTDAASSPLTEDAHPTSDSHRNPATAGGFALAAGLGVAATVLAARPAAAQTPAQTYAGNPLTFNDIPGTGDIKVLNFALALEDLEADLYEQAIMRLTKGGTTPYGERITGLNISGPQLRYFREFGRVEKEHAAFLRSAITSAGGTPITKFRHTFGLGNTTATPLNAQQLFSVILDAERTGVAAYLGGVRLFQPGSPYLLTANSIQGTEARHTAVIFALGDLLYNLQANIGPVPSSVSSPARNDIDPYAREVTENSASTSARPLVTTPPTPTSFEAQPDTVAEPNAVLAKVSPFIVRADAPNLS